MVLVDRSPRLDLVFHALAHPARRAIVRQLSLGGERNLSELASPLKMAGGNSAAARLRMKRSMSMSLLYDADADDAAQSLAFDDAFAGVDSNRSPGLETLDADLRASLLGGIDELVEELDVRMLSPSCRFER